MAPPSEHRAEYVARINRVLDYIEAHLHEELPLDRLAKVASFSPHHFHRIFGAMMGETLHRFITRVRLERAATQLLQQPGRSVTDIALDSGFASSATFARAFRTEFGTSASEWRTRCGDDAAQSMQDLEDRKIRKPLRKGRKDLDGSGDYGGLTMQTTSETPRPERPEMTVDVQSLDAQRVAYLRHVGPYQGDADLFGALFGRLATWAGPRGLLGPDARFMSVYHDNPNVTEADKLRTSICVTIGPDTEVDGEIGAMEIPAGRYAVARFRIDADQYSAAWDALMAGWLPDSGFQPDDRLCFERYLNDPEQDPQGKHEVEICLPVRPL